MRDYGLEPTVWDGDPNCQHQWGTEVVKHREAGGPQVPQTKWQADTGLVEAQRDTRSQFCQLCGAWRGALGLEPSPELYVKHIVDIFREVRRTMRDDGTCWLNIGDSYAGSGKGIGSEPDPKWPGARCDEMKHKTDWKQTTLKPKDLCLIPERLAIALQMDGWWIRCRIPWVKLNSMPSSQGDRPTVSHEYIFLMSKAQRYYYDQEGVKVPMAECTKERDKYGYTGAFKGQFQGTPNEERWQNGRPIEKPNFYKESGRIRRTTDWWFDSLSDLFSDEFMAFALPTEPFTMEMCKACKQVYNRREYNKLGVLIIPAEQSETGKEQKKRICAGCGSTDDWLSHFATFGEKLVTPMILAGTSPQACPHCGAGWKRVVERNSPSKEASKGEKLGWSNEVGQKTSNAQTSKSLHRHGGGVYSTGIDKGFKPTCQCENNDGSGHAIVFDPFAGSGTTCVVAKKLGRAYVGIEQNSDYCILAEKRIEETEIEAQPDEEKQLDLFR